MMGHQAGNTIASTDPAQKAGTVQGVKPSLGHRRPVPDVVQPGRRYQGTIGQPESLSNTLCPVPNTLDMPPPSRQLGQIALGQNPRISGRHHGFEPYEKDGQAESPRTTARRRHRVDAAVAAWLRAPPRSKRRGLIKAARAKPG